MGRNTLDQRQDLPRISDARWRLSLTPKPDP